MSEFFDDDGLRVAARQHGFEAVDLGRDRIGRNAGDRTDLRCGNAFEIEEQYLPVGRVEPVDDRQDQHHRAVAIGALERRGVGIGDLDILD